MYNSFFYSAKEEKEDDYSKDEDHLLNSTNLLNGHESLIVKTNNEKIRDLNFTLAIAYNNGAIEYEHLGKI